MLSVIFLFSLSSLAHKLSIAGFLIKLLFKALMTAICNVQILFLNKFVVVVDHSLKHVQHFVTPWTAARQASLSFTISITYAISGPLSGDAIQPSCLLSSPSPPAFNLSQHQDLF